MARSVVLPVVIMTCCISARAEDDPKITALMSAERECLRATQERDYAKIADLTYPKAVKFFGGRTAYIRVITRAMEEYDRHGISFVSTKPGNPSKLLKEGDNTFAIVPHEVIIKIPEGKVLIKSYSLGISADDGKTWTFVGGDGLVDEKLRDRLLPKLPAELKLPEIPEPEPISVK